jgi:FtsH-binding integral membrane protein
MQVVVEVQVTLVAGLVVMVVVEQQQEKTRYKQELQILVVVEALLGIIQTLRLLADQALSLLDMQRYKGK